MMARIQSKKILVGVLLFWIVVSGIGLQLNSGVELSNLLEVLSYLALLMFIATRRGIPEVFGKIGYLRLGGILAIFGMVLLGQIAGRERVTYPFTPWSMFCGVNPPQFYFEYLAKTA